jgi:hypothetical protein
MAVPGNYTPTLVAIQDRVWNGARQQWMAGSGAFFDMNSNTRRHETWTSADAAGLAILPGLVCYDEVYDPNINEIRHAFRITVRAALASSTGFSVNTTQVSSSTVGNIVATYAGVNKSATITVNPAPSPAIAALLIVPAKVVVGSTAAATVTLTAPAPAGGTLVSLASARLNLASTPANLLVPAGATSATFNVKTTRARRNTVVGIRGDGRWD